MSLNAAAWKTAIIFSMESSGLLNGLSQPEKDSIEDAWNIACQAHVNHITNNAVVDIEIIGMATGTGGPIGPYPIGLPVGTKVTGQGNPTAPVPTGGIS
jgi:hypothetical protein